MLEQNTTDHGIELYVAAYLNQRLHAVCNRVIRMKHVVEPSAHRQAAWGSCRVELACCKAPKWRLLAGIDSTECTEEACWGANHDEVVNLKEELLQQHFSSHEG